jgi:hypothetical protein
MRQQHIALRSALEWAAAIAPARISTDEAMLENLSVRRSMAADEEDCMGATELDD